MNIQVLLEKKNRIKTSNTFSDLRKNAQKKNGQKIWKLMRKMANNVAENSGIRMNNEQTETMGIYGRRKTEHINVTKLCN